VEVEVDPDTGFVRPETVWIAHDIGRAINRRAVEGQIEGSVYMALGEALMEKTEYNRYGLHRGPNLLDYKSPTAKDMPEIRVFLIETEDPGGPFGAKEVGQGPLLPVIPALVNAVYDAIGIRFDEIPITPPKVLDAILRGKKRVGPKKSIPFPFPKPIKVGPPHAAAR
jgi:CO/xanthine dehydrogenase Mo-binding subunit